MRRKSRDEDPGTKVTSVFPNPSLFNYRFKVFQVQVKMSNKQFKSHSPETGASGLEGSFLNIGTTTFMSECPRCLNQSTHILNPRQENVSLFPWLKK